ncbi:Uncharacterized protein APZ42_032422 [Daphnia magna]|uniref:Uncharacterized protein n=1 Tax=Daphnia magna TaxID=35525 RepID=A0A164M042_9CRUS|nr:Uncharacterized protein APZ42_032422 [Daphnia magna]
MASSRKSYLKTPRCARKTLVVNRRPGILSLYNPTNVTIRNVNVAGKDAGEILVAYKQCLINKFRECEKKAKDIKKDLKDSLQKELLLRYTNDIPDGKSDATRDQLVYDLCGYIIRTRHEVCQTWEACNHLMETEESEMEDFLPAKYTYQKSYGSLKSYCKNRQQAQTGDNYPPRLKAIALVWYVEPSYKRTTRKVTQSGIYPSPEASTKSEMTANADLIAALQGFTTAVATDAAARQNQMTQVFQIIRGRQQNHATLQEIVAVPPNAPAIRPSTVAMNSLPHFSEGWTDDNCLLVAVTRLKGTTSQWHTQTGHNQGTWAFLSAALVTNFAHTLSFLEWSLVLEARVQKPGESCLEYALDKCRLCLRSPIPLQEADIIKALLRGLANPFYIAVLTAQLPATFMDFLNRLRDFEQIGLCMNIQSGPPVTSVWIEKVGEVTALVDSGASNSAVRLSVVCKFLDHHRKPIRTKLRGVDNRVVRVEGTLPLSIKWRDRFVAVDQVTLLRTAPFALILGVDWIVKCETNTIVREGRIELVGEGEGSKIVETEGAKILGEYEGKKVRWAKDVHIINEGEEEEVTHITQCSPSDVRQMSGSDVDFDRPQQRRRTF